MRSAVSARKFQHFSGAQESGGERRGEEGREGARVKLIFREMDDWDHDNGAGDFDTRNRPVSELVGSYGSGVNKHVSTKGPQGTSQWCINTKRIVQIMRS